MQHNYFVYPITSILPIHNVWTCAGWVLADGTVVFSEDCGNIDTDPVNEYYILLQHRNHPGELSPDPVDMPCAGGNPFAGFHNKQIPISPYSGMDEE